MYQPECNLVYQYDASGAIIGFTYYPYSGTATQYFFGKNAQGDVICIYDAWGNILSTTGSMASTLGAANPFRYRGYYYDTESGLYYLNSRYYDPQVGRFINADGIVGSNADITGYNMFGYCNNNPVMHTDTNGYWFFDWEDVTNAWNGICDAVSDTWNEAIEWASDAWDATVEWTSNAWDVTTEWVSAAYEEVSTVACDVTSIIFSNISASGGICVGAGGSLDVTGGSVEAVVRMDIIGFRIEDGKFMLGRNEREALNVTVDTPVSEVMIGIQNNAFYDFNDNLISTVNRRCRKICWVLSGTWSWFSYRSFGLIFRYLYRLM